MQVNHMPLLLLTAFKKSSHRPSPAPSLAILICASFTVEPFCTRSDWINSVNLKKVVVSMHMILSHEVWRRLLKGFRKKEEISSCAVWPGSPYWSPSRFFFLDFFSSACLLLVSCCSFPLIYISQKSSSQSSKICYLKKGSLQSLRKTLELKRLASVSAEVEGRYPYCLTSVFFRHYVSCSCGCLEKSKCIYEVVVASKLQGVHVLFLLSR